LECWQHARKLAVWIYQSTSDFPEKERFGLVSQMRRAAISVASNIAEGTSRKTAKDQAHFSTIAYGSAIELLNQLIITNDLNYLSNQLYQQGRELLERQTILISKLRATQI
jgi:four helix bundle protein